MKKRQKRPHSKKPKKVAISKPCEPLKVKIGKRKFFDSDVSVPESLPPNFESLTVPQLIQKLQGNPVIPMSTLIAMNRPAPPIPAEDYQKLCKILQEAKNELKNSSFREKSIKLTPRTWSMLPAMSISPPSLPISISPPSLPMSSPTPPSLSMSSPPAFMISNHDYLQLCELLKDAQNELKNSPFRQKNPADPEA